MEVHDVTQLKYEAERELNKVKEEIERKRLTDLIYEDKLNVVLDRHAPHNNIHIPINEVHPIIKSNQNYSNRKNNNNLKSSSLMVFDKEELQANSNFIKIGQNLVGESEFLPIKDNNENFTKKFNHEKNKDFTANNSNLYNNFNDNNVQEKNNYGINMNELYSHLDDITELNGKMNIASKYRTFKHDYNKDIKSIEKVGRPIAQVESNDILKYNNIIKEVLNENSSYNTERDNDKSEIVIIPELPVNTELLIDFEESKN